MSKIFLIEDDAFLRKIYEKKLAEHEGWTVLTAENGEEGLQKIFTEKPDLILLDVMLPGKDGFQIITEIKQQEGLKEIPVIITTGLGQESDVKKGLDLGAVDYLTKDGTTVERIIEKVEQYLKDAPTTTPAVAPEAPKPAPAPEAQPKTCTGCNAALPEGAKFCPGCGQAA